MSKGLTILFWLIFINSQVSSQIFNHYNELKLDSIQNTIQPLEKTKFFTHAGMVGEFAKFETFVGANIGGQSKHWFYDSRFQISIGQLALNRFFPRLRVSSGYYFLDNGGLKIGPLLALGISYYNYEKNKEGRNYYFESLAGYQLMAGRSKIKFIHSLGGGLLSVGYYNIVRQKYAYVTNLTFTLSIGLSYEI